MIAPCTCKHEAQDKMYGNGRRVFNEGKLNYICTVCGAKRPLTGNEKKDKKKKGE